MRKILSLTLVMLITFSAITSAVFLHINKEKDNVTVSEAVRYGDRSFAENIKISFKSNYQNALYWDTEYTIGDEDSAETKFRFYKNRKYYGDSQKFLNMYSAFNYDYYNRDKNIGINKAYNELASNAEPYIEVKKEILLSDYYEYYPYEIDISFPGKISISTDFNDVLSESHKEFVETFRNFFKIPIIENHRMIINLMVDENGDIRQTGSSDADNGTGDFSFYSDAAVSDDEFFICFSNKTTTGLSVDTSEIPGGYGIYALPFSENEKEVSLDAKNLKNIYPIDDENEIYSMYLSEDNTKLFVLIKSSGNCKALIIDTDTYKKLGEFTITENMKSEDFAYLQGIKDNYVIANFYVDERQEEYYKIFTCDDSYNYKEEYTVPIYKTISDEKTKQHISCGTYPGSLSQIEFDGEYLYISSDNIDNNYDTMCPHTGFTMVIYGKDGLVYHGDYDTSLSAGNDGNFNSNFYVNSDYENTVNFSLP